MKLREIYKRLPDIKCEQGCTDCCSPVYMLPSEAKKMGLERTYTKWDEHYDCEFKTPTGCSIWENRPFLCRFFGCSGSGIFSCPKVKGDLISDEKSKFLLQQYIKIVVDSNNMVPEDLIDAMQKHDIILRMQGKLRQRNPKRNIQIT